MQQEAMESDDREGIVQDYLDRLLPDNWASMDIYQRRAFLGGGEFETVGVKGTVMRERVCIMEIWVECFGKERQNLKKAADSGKVRRGCSVPFRDDMGAESR